MPQTKPIKRNLQKRALTKRLTRILPERTLLSMKAFREDALVNFNNRCAYCGAGNVKLTRDHIIPQKEWGTIELPNIIPACGPCNDHRRETPWRDFALSKGSRFIEFIEKRVTGYIPLDIDLLRRVAEPSVRDAFERYDRKIQEINQI